jgi:hypothetical protein
MSFSSVKPLVKNRFRMRRSDSIASYFNQTAGEERKVLEAR